MDSITDLVLCKLVEHEGKVRFRLEGMSARYTFLYEALEDYLKSPELAERRVAVFPTVDGGQYVVNTQSGIVSIGEARFTQYVEIHCNSYRSPRGKEVPEPGQPVFIKLTVDDGQKSKRQCIMLSLFDRTPSVIEHFTWLVGYMCERFPDAALTDDIEDEALREERKKLAPSEDVNRTTYAPDLMADRRKLVKITQGSYPTYRVDAVQFERWLKKYLKDLSESATFKPATELGLKSYQYVSSYFLTAVLLPNSPKPILLDDFLQLALLTDRSYTLTFLFGYSDIFFGENRSCGVLFRLDLKPSLSGLDVTLQQEYERLEGFYRQFRENIEWEFPGSALRTDTSASASQETELTLPPTPVETGEAPASVAKPGTGASGEQEPVKNSPRELIGEYVFSGTPEEFITVALAEAEVLSLIHISEPTRPY